MEPSFEKNFRAEDELKHNLILFLSTFIMNLL